jgi:aspartyl/asparaginyl-tRNA synthetase
MGINKMMGIIGSTRKLTLEELNSKREEYRQVEWESAKGDKTRVINIDNDYLLNIIRKVHEKIQVAKAYPLITEFQSYNDISYEEWSAILYNEYLWREENLEKEYNDYLDLEIQMQTKYDRDYFESWSEYGYPF